MRLLVIVGAFSAFVAGASLAEAPESPSPVSSRELAAALDERMVSGEGAVFPDPSLALVMKAGAIRLDSGDWLVNQHEYWHDLDPFVSDGTNTELSILARSIDERIAGRNPATALTHFSDYPALGSNASTNALVPNFSCWAADVDFSCESPWNSESKNRKSGTVSFAKILPVDFSDCLHTGSGLPAAILDQQGKILVAEISRIGTENTNEPPARCVYRQPQNPNRLVFFESLVAGDFANPDIVIMRNDPILLSITWSAVPHGTSILNCKNATAEAMEVLSPNRHFRFEHVSFDGFPKVRTFQK